MLNSDCSRKRKKIFLNAGSDLNNLTSVDALYSVASGTVVKNAPNGLTGISVYCLPGTWGTIQIAIQYNVPITYIRIKFSDWSAWYKISMTNL